MIYSLVNKSCTMYSREKMPQAPRARSRLPWSLPWPQGLAARLAFVFGGWLGGSAAPFEARPLAATPGQARWATLGRASASMGRPPSMECFGCLARRWLTVCERGRAGASGGERGRTGASRGEQGRRGDGWLRHASHAESLNPAKHAALAQQCAEQVRPPLPAPPRSAPPRPAQCGRAACPTLPAGCARARHGPSALGAPDRTA